MVKIHLNGANEKFAKLGHDCTKVKDAAAAMGHSVETHNSFYGSYTTELSLEKAFERHLENRIEV